MPRQSYLLYFLINIVNKGISGHLLKATASKRRSKAQIKEEKAIEERKQQEVVKKMSEYERMKEELANVHQIIEEKEHYRQMLGHMYENGVIKQDVDGSFVPVDDPLERESIRSKTKQKLFQESQSQAEES